MSGRLTPGLAVLPWQRGGCSPGLVIAVLHSPRRSGRCDVCFTPDCTTDGIVLVGFQLRRTCAVDLGFSSPTYSHEEKGA